MKRTITITITLILLITLAIPVRTTSWTQHQANKELAHQIAEMLRSEGHPEDHPVIQACQEWWMAEDSAGSAEPEYTTREQRCQHPVAATDWQILRENGISEVCAAAIIGNWMAETGGQTLDYDPYMQVGGFYGKAMWSELYFPDVVGKSSVFQTLYTIDTLEKQFGSHLEAFLVETDVRKAARMFSDYYERPRHWAEERADNAEAAYRYFVGE